MKDDNKKTKLSPVSLYKLWMGRYNTFLKKKKKKITAIPPP